MPDPGNPKTSNQMVFWFCGLPGIGKDFCAQILAKIAGIPHLDGDLFLTPADKKSLIRRTFSSRRRLAKLARMAKQVKKLLATYPHLAVTDSLPDNASRNFLWQTFKEKIIFILVSVSPKIHLRRLGKRKNHFFKAGLLSDWVTKHWEKITIPHLVLKNDKSGPPLERQIYKIFKKWDNQGRGQGNQT